MIPEPQRYNTIERSSFAEVKDRGSRFLAYAFYMESKDDFKKHIQALKKEHVKAEHHCFAYRIGTDGNNFRVSDDGEPAGSAGKPILGQIDSRQLTNVAVIVLRYFGGTLLGVPSLINAYKSATAMALQLTPNIQKPIVVTYHLSFDYTLMNEVMQIAKRTKCEIVNSEVQLFCSMHISVPKEYLDQFLDKLKDLRLVEVKKVS